MKCPDGLVPMSEILEGDFESMKRYFRSNNTSGKTFYVRRIYEDSCYMLGQYKGTANYSIYDPETFKHHVTGYTVKRTEAEVAEINENTLLFSEMPFTRSSMGDGIQICTGPAPAPASRSWFSFGGKKNRKTASKKRRRTKNRRTKNRRTKDRRTKRKTLRR
jgi:hypothetical protein